MLQAGKKVQKLLNITEKQVKPVLPLLTSHATGSFQKLIVYLTILTWQHLKYITPELFIHSYLVLQSES